MKGSLKFDPREYEYGAATEAIRTILSEWTEIDWFEPDARRDDDAASLFRQHQRLAHAEAPDLFSKEIDLRIVTGDRDEFTSWCQRVRTQTSWDWKFSVLKTLSNKHANSHAWSPETEAGKRPLAPPRPGDLFFVLGDANGTKQVIWNSVMPTPTALDAMPREGFGEAARFYFSYATYDALDCIKWQFAEGSADMSTNPFLPLLLCYEAGAYPFSLGQDQVVLFRFEQHPSN